MKAIFWFECAWGCVSGLKVLSFFLVQQSPESDDRFKLSIYQRSVCSVLPNNGSLCIQSSHPTMKNYKCLVGFGHMAHKSFQLTNVKENSSMEKVSWAGTAQPCLYSSFIFMESCHGTMITKSSSVKTLLLFVKELLQVKMKITGSMSNVCIVILPDPVCENHREAKLFFTHLSPFDLPLEGLRKETTLHSRLEVVLMKKVCVCPSWYLYFEIKAKILVYAKGDYPLKLCFVLFCT